MALDKCLMPAIQDAVGIKGVLDQLHELQRRSRFHSGNLRPLRAAHTIARR